MKKHGKKNKLAILCGVLVVLIIATVLISTVEQKTEKIKTSGDTVLALEAGDITGLSWVWNDDEYSFTKTDGTWSWDEDAGLPVDQDAFEELVSYFEDVRADFIIEDVEDYSQYGLKSPYLVITATTEEGTTSISCGNYSNMDSLRYIDTGDGNVYLAKEDPAESFEILPEDLIQLDTVPSFYSKIMSFTVERSAALASEAEDDDTDKPEDEITLVHSDEEGLCYSDEYEYYVKDGYEYKFVSTSGSQTFIKYLSNLSLTSYAVYDASSVSLADYGLETPCMTATAVYEDSDGVEATYRVFFGEVGDNHYCMPEGANIIYYTADSTFEALRDTSYQSLRPEELLLLDWDEVTTLEIELDGESYTMTVAEGQKDEDGNDIDFSGLEDAVDGLSVTEYTEASAEKKLELSLTVNRDNEKYPSLELEFYKYDSDSCLAYVNGKSYALVQRSGVVDLIEEINSIVL